MRARGAAASCASPRAHQPCGVLWRGDNRATTMRVLTGLAACLVLATAIAGSTPFGTGHGVHRDVPLHLVLPHTHMTRDGAVVSHSPHVVNQAPNAASSSTADQSGRALGGEALISSRIVQPMRGVRHAIVFGHGTGATTDTSDYKPEARQASDFRMPCPDQFFMRATICLTWLSRWAAARTTASLGPRPANCSTLLPVEYRSSSVTFLLVHRQPTRARVSA
jgi:hypothetical protein